MELTTELKSEIENSPKYKKLLSRISGEDIQEIQVTNYNSDWKVLYFWKDFWWFKKRDIITLKEFLKLVNPTDIYETTFIMVI